MAGTLAYLDHLAVAAESWQDLWPRYRTELGGVWVSGDDEEGAGFAPAQVRYANNMKVEALMPLRPEDNDFLRRFLDQRGPGPHHMTFKVPDIRKKLSDLEAAGYRPVGVYMPGPEGWQEMFIHPKDGPGIVVQVAQSPFEWKSEPKGAFPETTQVPAASLDYFALGVADRGRALELLIDLLDGERVGEGRDELFGYDWLELGWTSGARLRVFDAPESAVHHVAFTLPDPAALAGAKPLEDGRFDVPAEANLGVRLVVSAG